MSNNRLVSIRRRAAVPKFLCIGILLILVNLCCQGSALRGAKKASLKDCFVEFNQVIGKTPYRFCITRMQNGEEYLYDSVFYFSRTDTAMRGSFGVNSELDASSTTPNWHFQDINFDGKVDFCFYTLKGNANMTGQYWLYNKNGKFSYLGEYPALVPDKAKNLVGSYERGGYAGLEYESNEYFFNDNNLVKCKTLSQKFNKTDGDTSYFILTETAKPPCGTINKKTRLKVFQINNDSTVVDTLD